VLPSKGAKGVQARIRFGSWEMLPVFKWLREAGNLTWPEMLQIFNCGVGYCMIVDKNVSNDVLERLKALDVAAWHIGEIEAYDGGEDRVIVDF
jgi:phosphoribosylformylglycinamidine cyclo-ligase